MKKFGAFLYAYKNSIGSTSYYKDVIATKNSFTFKYFLFLCLVMSLILSIKLSFDYLPKAKVAMVEASKSAKALYEPDLIFTSQDNSWAVNKPEPYIIAMPEYKPEESQTDASFPKNLVVFSHSGTIDDVKNLHTLILVNAKNILVQEQESLRVYPLEDIPNGVINKQAFEMLIDRVYEWARVFIYFMPIVFFILGYLFFVVIKGSNLFFVGFFVWGFSALAKYQVGFTDAVKISAHALSFPITVYVGLKMFGRDLNSVFWVEIATFLIAAFVILNLRRQSKQT